MAIRRVLQRSSIFGHILVILVFLGGLSVFVGLKLASISSLLDQPSRRDTRNKAPTDGVSFFEESNTNNNSENEEKQQQQQQQLSKWHRFPTLEVKEILEEQPAEEPRRRPRRTLLFLRSHRGRDSFQCDLTKLWGPDIDAEFIAEILYDFDHRSIDLDELPTITNNSSIDVLAFSSNIYSIAQVEQAIRKLRPSVLLHLSDEAGDRPVYEQRLFPHFRLVYRQYRFEKPGYQNPTNQRILPIGYHCWDRHIAPNATNKLPTERKYVWSFIGTMKGQRKQMVEELDASLQPNFHGTTTSNKGNAEIYADSRYIVCPRGNFNVETSRMYMATRSGAIPVTIMSQADWNELYSHFDIPPPWFRADTVQGAIQIIQDLEHQPPQVLIETQRRMLQWWEDIKVEIRRHIVEAVEYCHDPNTKSDCPNSSKNHNVARAAEAAEAAAARDSNATRRKTSITY